MNGEYEYPRYPPGHPQVGGPGDPVATYVGWIDYKMGIVDR